MTLPVLNPKANRIAHSAVICTTALMHAAFAVYLITG